MKCPVTCFDIDNIQWNLNPVTHNFSVAWCIHFSSFHKVNYLCFSWFSWFFSSLFSLGTKYQVKVHLDFSRKKLSYSCVSNGFINGALHFSAGIALFLQGWLFFDHENSCIGLYMSFVKPEKINPYCLIKLKKFQLQNKPKLVTLLLPVS